MHISENVLRQESQGQTKTMQEEGRRAKQRRRSNSGSASRWHAMCVLSLLLLSSIHPALLIDAFSIVPPRSTVRMQGDQQQQGTSGALSISSLNNLRQQASVRGRNPSLGR